MMLVSRVLCICIFCMNGVAAMKRCLVWWFEEIDVNMQDMSKLV